MLFVHQEFFLIRDELFQFATKIIQGRMHRHQVSVQIAA